MICVPPCARQCHANNDECEWYQTRYLLPEAIPMGELRGKWGTNISVVSECEVMRLHLWHLISFLLFIACAHAVMSPRHWNSSFRIEPPGLMAISGLSGPLSICTALACVTVVGLQSLICPLRCVWPVPGQSRCEMDFMTSQLAVVASL